MVAEGLVHDQHGVHVIHDKSDLVGADDGVREELVGPGHRGHQTHHDGVVENGAVLRRGDTRRGGDQMSDFFFC